jgi:hypothetical protein
VAATIALVGLGSGLYLTARLGAGHARRPDDRPGAADRRVHPRDAGRARAERVRGGRGARRDLRDGTLAFALLVGPAVQLALGRLGAPGGAGL